MRQSFKRRTSCVCSSNSHGQNGLHPILLAPVCFDTSCLHLSPGDIVRQIVRDQNSSDEGGTKVTIRSPFKPSEMTIWDLVTVDGFYRIPRWERRSRCACPPLRDPPNFG
jgi:hypothetical protein